MREGSTKEVAVKLVLRDENEIFPSEEGTGEHLKLQKTCVRMHRATTGLGASVKWKVLRSWNSGNMVDSSRTGQEAGVWGRKRQHSIDQKGEIDTWTILR